MSRAAVLLPTLPVFVVVLPAAAGCFGLWGSLFELANGDEVVSWSWLPCDGCTAGRGGRLTFGCCAAGLADTAVAMSDQDEVTAMNVPVIWGKHLHRVPLPSGGKVLGPAATFDRGEGREERRGLRESRQRRYDESAKCVGNREFGVSPIYRFSYTGRKCRRRVSILT